MNDQDKFEAWAQKRGMELYRVDAGSGEFLRYDDCCAKAAWAAWQAHDSGKADNPYLEVFARVEDGHITTNPEFVVIGFIHNMDYQFIGEIEEAVIEHVLNYEKDIGNIPSGVDGVTFMVSDVRWSEGQQSHYGIWDFPPHWEMNIDLIEPHRKDGSE